MKLAIISDTHLGKRMYRTEEGFINKFEKAGYDAYDKNIEIIINENPDIFINCGDVFDTPNPSVLAMNKFKEGEKKLSHIPSLFVLGNHDFSFKNKYNNCSSIETLINRKNIEAYADYDIVKYTKNDVAFILIPYVYCKAEERKVIWEKAIKLVNECTETTKILLTHGATEYSLTKMPLIKEDFMIPNTLVEKFDVVFIGHIHTPFEHKYKNTLIVSPGGLIDYQANTVATGPVIYNTDTKQLERHIVDTPHIIKKTLDNNTINDFLKNVNQKIYNITYTGDVSKIDNDLFIKAKEISINLVLNLEEIDSENAEISAELETNFYKWVNKHYPEKSNKFLDAKNSLKMSDEF